MFLENTSAERIAAIHAAQRDYFRSGATLPADFRRIMLRRLEQALRQWERRLCDALWQDLRKSPEEACLTELSIVRSEVRNHLRHLGRWMRPERRPSPLKLFPSASRILSEPLGTALIVSPWNYPVQLLLNPLVGAISAGCTAVLKPSPYTPHVSATLRAMIGEIYDERDDARQSPHYVRLVNDRAFDRVASYLAQGTVRLGGRTDRAERYIEPTLLTEVDPLAPVMREEIFGPVLPVVPFRTTDEAVAFVTEREKPLALYYFGPEKSGREVLRRTSSGGTCLNDTIMHIANEHLPFGGVGNSGMGRYHGRDSFDAFSHRRAVVETPTWIDPPFRYMPYKLFRYVKRIL